MARSLDWNSRCVEPVQRKVGGRFGFAFHRFPIKDGITPMKAHGIVMREAVSRANPMFLNTVRQSIGGRS